MKMIWKQINGDEGPESIDNFESLQTFEEIIEENLRSWEQSPNNPDADVVEMVEKEPERRRSSGSQEECVVPPRPKAHLLKGKAQSKGGKKGDQSGTAPAKGSTMASQMGEG